MWRMKGTELTQDHVYYCYTKWDILCNINIVALNSTGLGTPQEYTVSRSDRDASPRKVQPIRVGIMAASHIIFSRPKFQKVDCEGSEIHPYQFQSDWSARSGVGKPHFIGTQIHIVAIRASF